MKAGLVQAPPKRSGQLKNCGAGEQPRYVPPVDVRTISVEEALQYCGRRPAPRQGELFGGGGRKERSTFFYAGDLSLLRRPCVAVVGTRRVSREGALRAKRLARELAEVGVVVVSGLAAGVDSCAHWEAIERGGKTIAVIGTPLDRVYPPENAALQQIIYSQHLLISQFAPGAKVGRLNFPLRNRLMALLTDATVVIEASDTSGTLHQAAECRRLGRWLFVARSVAAQEGVKWPKSFESYEKFAMLHSTDDILSKI